MIRFADHFRSSGFEVTRFFPCYGLAEATLLVTTSRASDPLKVLPSPSAPADAVAAAPARAACGKAWAPGEVLVVDPESRLPCPPGTTGEIWVAGPHVAMGYWQQPEETTRTFRARPASPAGEERYFLRTGDLGFLWNEELYIDGRLKDLIIVGGQNHHPNDIEETVQQSHPMVHPRGSAAFSVTRNGQEELIVLAELDRKAILRSVTAPADLPAALTELKFAVHHAVRKEIAEQHALTVREIVFLNPSAIPKTTSGKVQRHAAREAYLLGTLDTVL
jgi:acyl-CoA synthetase (AMP-forming)/AMP-acid ligase II